MLSEILLHGQILYCPPKGHLVSAVSPDSTHGCAEVGLLIAFTPNRNSMFFLHYYTTPSRTVPLTSLICPSVELNSPLLW